MNDWRVKLGWLAQNDLDHMGWHDERELGGCLFGQIDHSRRRIYVERVHANPSGPHERHRTGFDGPYFVALERFDRGLRFPLRSSQSETEFRIVGDVHSHPSGESRASDKDFDAWRFAAERFKHPFLGIVATAGSERWEAGVPTGRPNWDDLVLAGWLSHPNGEVWAPTVHLEERFVWAFEQKQAGLRQAQGHA